MDEQEKITTELTDDPERAARHLRRGETVAFPTETVYGLGANAFDETAVARIYLAKGRPQDNPLIVHIADQAQLAAVAREIPAAARQFIAAFFPGPLTLVVPRHPRIPLRVTAGLETVGVRMPRHPVAQAFLRACGVPVAAPSANLSGKPSPTTWQAVAADLTGRISCILQGDQTEVGLESTVVDCTATTPVILREGAVTLEQLREIVPETRGRRAADEALPKSPGMKYRHYAPASKVILVHDPAAVAVTPDSAATAWIGLAPHPRAAALALHRQCADVGEYAHALFDFFRQCDAAGVRFLYCQAVPETGLGRALMDRIRRAAETGAG
ncbi:MAG: L-threonylcarbamoyladenylate synthase [Blastocatellia bacterium]